MSNTRMLTAKMLEIDCSAVVGEIISRLTKQLGIFRRRGYVVAVSGGIDSSATLGLCVKAVGADHVVALLMPEKDSADDTLDLSRLVAEKFQVRTFHEDITEMLDAVGFDSRFENAVRKVIPEYGKGWKSKIVLPGVVDNPAFNLYSIVAQTPDGEITKKRLTLDAYLGIVAATNFKQRIRKMFEYHYADLFNYAVAGTPNRLEYDQGFFVKLGDGAADIKPIAHLYKTQVYKIAEHLGVPNVILGRPPTTDTYSLAQGQDEFYFALPYDKMDLCLYGMNNGFGPDEVAPAVGLTAEQVSRVFKDIATKRSTTQYLHLPPMLAGDVPEITSGLSKS